MNTTPDETTAAASGPPSRGNPGLAVLVALLFPGAGHFYLGRRARALFFAAIVLTCVVLGVVLDGKLFQSFEGPFAVLRTLASMSAGLPYLFLRFGVGYDGDVRSVGYEYGSTFLITAGLMNLLLIFDSWDAARGKDAAPEAAED